MLTVVSPAKRLNPPPAAAAVGHSQPVLLDETLTLMKTTRKLSQGKLKRLMGISDTLAELNHDRFQQFAVPFNETNARQAALSFNGDTYLGLDASTLSQQDLDFAQEHLVILSGLYGVLRPLDLIQPYRLEMGTSLKTRRGTNLYAFWGDRLTQQLNDWSQAHPNPTLINLASNEYFKALKPKALNGSVITPVFKEIKGEKSRTISFLAKKSRGMMARYIVQHRLNDPEALKDFTEGGYTFQPKESTDTRWVFSRPQPPPVNG